MAIAATGVTAGESIVFNQVVNIYEAPEPLCAPGNDEPTDLNPQFDAVKDCLDGRHFAAAAAVLDTLEKNHAGRFTKHTWYRLFAFRGHLCRMRGELREAAAFYFRAKGYRPDLENALVFEVLGHLLLDDGKAFELADALRETHPSSASATGLYIQAAPRSVPFARLEEVASSVPVPSAEVLYGMAQAAHERGDFDRAKAFAKRVVDIDGASVEAKSLWAICVLQQHQGMPPVQDDTHRAELAEVRTALDECIKAMRAESPPQHVAHQYINLAAATRLLGEENVADDLVREAKRIAPNDEDVRCQFSYIHRRNGRVEAALAELGAGIDSAPPRRQLIWAQIKAQQGGAANFKIARDLLAANIERLSDEVLVLQQDWYKTLVKLHMTLDSLDEAERLVQSRDGQARLTLLCRGTWAADIARRRGDLESALRLAKTSLFDAPPDADSDELRDLASILEKLDDAPAALEALKRSVDVRSDLAGITHAIGLAWKVRDEDFILQFGEKLRKAGRLYWVVLDAEISVSLAAGPSRAEGFLKQLLDELPDGREARFVRMRLTHLGIHVGRMDLCEQDPSRLPCLDEVDPQIYAVTVQALRYTSEPLHACEFAYALVRKFPNLLEAHVAMIASMGLPDDGHCPEIPQAGAAAVGTAVLVKDPADGKENWYVIEDAPNLQPTLNEVGSDSAIAEAVIGQVAGAEVDVREAFGTSRRVIILRVVHKYSYRFEDCFRNLPRLFPDQQLFKVFHVKKDVAPQKAFDEMLEVIRNIEGRESEAIEMYRQHPYPLHMLAHMAGSSELGAMSLLLHSPETFVRCCRGNTEENTQSGEALRHADSIVLEGQTLLTWFLLHEAYGIALWESITQWHGKIIVGEKTFDDMRKVHENLGSGRDRMGARRVGYEIVPAFSSGEALRASGERLAGLVDFLKSRCTILAGPSLNVIPADRRDMLLKVLGRASLESMILAQGNNAVLWTDDFAVAEFARELFDCQRVWTQLACRELVSAETTTKVTWAMLAFRYDFTSLSVDDALRAAQETRWDGSRFPLNQVLGYFSLPSPCPEGLIRIALSLLLKAWTHPVLGFQARDITFRLLTETSKREDGQRVIQSIDASVDLVFGLNVIAAASAKLSIRDWFRMNNMGQ